MSARINRQQREDLTYALLDGLTSVCGGDSDEWINEAEDMATIVAPVVGQMLADAREAGVQATAGPGLTYVGNPHATDRAETQPTTPRAHECETGDNAEEIRNA